METTIEKTYIKLNLKPVKDLIKSYEEKQRFYKDQKNGNIIWDPMHPSKAQSEAYWNRLELRIFYAAYALLRGKKLSQVEQKYTEDNKEHFFNTYKGKIEKTLEGFQGMSKIK